MVKLLIFIFVIILIGILYFLKKNKLENPLITLFLGTWICSFLVLFFWNEEGIAFVTFEGLLLIQGHIFSLIIGYLVFIFNINKRVVVIKPLFTFSIKVFFYFSLICSFVGLVLLFKKTDVISALIAEEVAKMRGDFLSKEKEVGLITVILTNFMYPLAAITPLYTIRRGKYFLLILVSLLFVMYSLANGGKGNAVILFVILLGAILLNYHKKIIIINKSVKYILTINLILILGFIQFINFTRSPDENKSDSQIFVEVFVPYFSGSIPAFSQLIKQKGWHLFSFNLSDHVIVREVSGIFGSKPPRLIDTNIVYIPEGFNVFSSIADSLLSIGLVLSLIYYFFIGVAFAYANEKYNNYGKSFLFSILFLFAFYSFYVDIFFFMVGSWYCLLAYLFVRIKL